MKTRFTLFFLSILALLLTVGCTNEIVSDLNVLERRIEKLETRCQEINTTIEGLRAIMERLQEYDFLTSVEPVTEDGEVIGYTLHFTHSDPITLYNGIDAGTPILGVAKGDDGVWYWTVQNPSDSEPHFLTDDFGVRIPTSAISPQLKIEDGFWYVTYDNGELWRLLGKATGEDGKSFFESVTNMGDYVQMNMINGTVIKIPTWESYEKLQDLLKKANENLETFTALARNFTEKVYVSNLVPILNGTDTIGMKLVLSDGKAYSFYNGTGTNVPVIGARKMNEKDDVWYWTIQYGDNPFQWILNEKGEKIQANAPDSNTPHLSLQQVDGDPAWYWAVTYGDEKPSFLLYDGKKVKASIEVPETVVQSIVRIRDDLVYVTLAGGLSLYIPMARSITVTFPSGVSNNTITMTQGSTFKFQCLITGADKETEVLPIAHDYFYATATVQTPDHTAWIIEVHSPTPFAAPSTGRLDLLISNGYGTMKNIAITILPAN